MDRVIYTVLTGLSAQGRAQQVTANNLANAGTTGFRREIVAEESRYLAAAATSRAESAGARSRAQAGAPSLSTPNAPGKADPTGRPLDIAMAGGAWLALQGPVVGGNPTELYTRRGDLTVTPGGLVQNGDGRAVLNAAGTPVTVPAGATLAVAPDGSLTASLAGVATPIGRLKLVAGAGLAGLDKTSEGQFATTNPLPDDPAARVAVGTLETSNVQTAGALAELIAQSRGFEVNARLLGVAKDIDERTARLMAFEAQ